MTAPAAFLLDTTEAIVEILRTALEGAGFIVASGSLDDLQRGRLDLPQQFELHRPSVIVFDVAMPYPRRWAILERLRAHPIAAGIPFVVTSPNVRRLREAVHTTEPIFEIAGEPDDISAIVRAAQDAVEQSKEPRAEGGVKA